MEVFLAIKNQTFLKIKANQSSPQEHGAQAAPVREDEQAA